MTSEDVVVCNHFNVKVVDAAMSQMQGVARWARDGGSNSDLDQVLAKDPFRLCYELCIAIDYVSHKPRLGEQISIPGLCAPPQCKV